GRRDAPVLSNACAQGVLMADPHGRGLATRTVRGTDDGRDGRRLYVLHGFFGQGRNWSSFARRLVELRPDWVVVLVDLRLHGDSLDLPGPHTLAAAAEDLVGLHEAAAAGAGNASDPPEAGSARPALLGHSFGGK